MYILQPLIVILITSGLVVYWRYKRSFRGLVFLYSLLAYGGAIALKYAVQIPTASKVVGYFGAQSVGYGIYVGLQTVVFEVGGAYLVARYVISRGMLTGKDAEAYGLGLAFWENVVLLGVLPIINLVAYYIILSTNTPLAQTVYAQLVESSPGLFSPASQVIGTMALGVVERISSTFFHFAWGYLCIMSAYVNKKRYLLLALPMGFVDFLVPFAQSFTLLGFEALVFALSLISVIVAWFTTRELRKNPENRSSPSNVLA
ncbi:MAG: YhfC family glutamic-type intramembrane protease [Nitrososphaeria archaeon]